MGQEQGQAQQIDPMDALEAFRSRHGELADENVLLRAQSVGLQRRVAELESEVARLQTSAPRDLGSAPAQQTPDGDDADFDQQNDLERVHGGSLYGGVMGGQMGQPISTQ